uniref:hypothetical protein n=1 Tax=Saccharospirillum impatiens TaxID=169438 RepID=UPI0005655053
MNKTTFRLIVGASLLLLVLQIVAVSYLSPDMSPELMKVLQDASFHGFWPISAGIALASLVGQIGLLFFQTWARALFTLSVLLLLPFSLLDGPVVTTAVVATLDTLMVLLGPVNTIFDRISAWKLQPINSKSSVSCYQNS